MGGQHSSHVFRREKEMICFLGHLLRQAFYPEPVSHTLRVLDHTWKSHECEVRSSEGINWIKSSHLSCLSGLTLLGSLQSALRVLSVKREIQVPFPACSFQGEFLPLGRFSWSLYLAIWVRCVARAPTLAVSVSSLSHRDFLTIYSP